MITQPTPDPHPLVDMALKTFIDRGEELGPEIGLKMKKLSKLFLSVADIVVSGSPIVPASQHLLATVRAANRIVSFVLDGKTHFGTGILVGPSHVLTAAHLFLEDDGQLIDTARMNRISVVVETTMIGDVLFKVSRRSASLNGAPSSCFVEPAMSGIHATREVKLLDFAIVRIDESFGQDRVADDETRGWFHIPPANAAPILTPEFPVRVLQYVDAKELRVATGFIRELTDTMRAAHTASTVDGSSGAPLLDDNGTLLAIHVSGTMSGIFPRSNYALPLANIATAIDTPNGQGTTARAILESESE